MLPKNNQFVYDLAKNIMEGANVTIPQTIGFSERIIEVPKAAHWLNKLSTNDNCNILDIGYTMSSLDWLGLLLILNKKENCTVNAKDIIRPERVKSRYPQEWLDDILKVPVEIGDIRKMKIPSNEFDVVTCISTIEHIGFDEADTMNPNSAFKRGERAEDVKLTRSNNVNAEVLAQFHKALKPGGHLIITTPMGKGGAVLLKDSLGLFTRQWEYETASWKDLVNQPGFSIIEESFFGLKDNGIWQEVSAPSDLNEKSSELKPHAHGCAFAVLRKI